MFLFNYFNLPFFRTQNQIKLNKSTYKKFLLFVTIIFIQKSNLLKTNLFKNLFIKTIILSANKQANK